jgi:hypothetical protein
MGHFGARIGPLIAYYANKIVLVEQRDFSTEMPLFCCDFETSERGPRPSGAP